MKSKKKVLILGASSDIGICVINEFLENWIRKPEPYVLGQEKDTGRKIMSNEDTSDFVWTLTKGTGGFTVKVKDHELRWMKENNKTWMELQNLKSLPD